MVVKEIKNQTIYAILITLIAYLCFAFVDSSAKYLTIISTPALQIAFMRYLGQFVGNACHLTIKGSFKDSLFCDYRGQLTLRAAFLVSSTACNFISLKYLPLTQVATILFSAPIMICVLSIFLLNEKVGIWRWSAIIFAFIGVVLIIQPNNINFHPATLLALLTALLFALYSIWTRKLANKCSNESMQLYTGLVGVCILIYFGVTEWQSPVAFSGWIILLTIGLVAWIGHIILTKAHFLTSPQIIMPFGYVYIIYIGIIDHFLFDNIPDTYTIIGGTMIITSGLFIIYREYKTKGQNK